MHVQAKIIPLVWHMPLFRHGFEEQRSTTENSTFFVAYLTIFVGAVPDTAVEHVRSVQFGGHTQIK